MKRTKAGLTGLEEYLLNILRSCERPVSAAELYRETRIYTIMCGGKPPSLNAVSAALRRLAQKGRVREKLGLVYSAAKRRAP